MTEFLLSYDRDDGDGGYVEEFFDDLSDELARRRAEWHKKTVGYLDVKVGTGSRWPERLNEALATTKVFVPLYSPRYFVSDYCGREWAVFADRVRTYERARNTSADLIIPVRWESTDRSTLPAVARTLQDNDSAFPQVYREIGLRRIVKLRRRYDQEYDAVVAALADRVLSSHRSHPLTDAAGPVDIMSVASAFSRLDRAEPVSLMPGAPAAPQRVYFVMAAATADEAVTIRHDPGGRYGSEPDEWMPFQPDDGRPLMMYANEVAQGQEPALLPKQESAGTRDLVELIREAERRNAIVVLIVDAWAIRLERYREALSPYDGIFSLHTAVIVTINRGDRETVENLPALLTEVRELFRRNHIGRSRFYRDGVTSVDEFRHELGKILVNAQSQVARLGDVPREMAAGPFGAPPIVLGPGAP